MDISGRNGAYSMNNLLNNNNLFINAQFNAFLQLTHDEILLIKKYTPRLSQGADPFARIFYDYLYAFPATSTILKNYQQRGNSISTLVDAQLRHLVVFLEADTGEQSAERLMVIGQIHYHANIEPEWIMGSYRLYLDHLQTIISTASEISGDERAPLSSILVKLLFRDMGLMLKGYWDAALEALQKEQDKVEELQNQVSSLLANIPQILWSIDVDHGKLLYLSPNSRKICDIDIDMPIPCLSWTVPEDKENVKQAWQRVLQGECVEVQSRIHAPGDTARWFRRVFHPFIDNTGKVSRIDGLMEDISESKKNMERLQYLATTDILTGLANRTLWYDRLNQAIVAASRKEKKQIVLMILDLNHFKVINDTLGHSMGDEVLVQTSQRLRSILRESDTLARLGGDEFAVLLSGVTNGVEAAEKIANAILGCFTQPFQCDTHQMHLGTAIGIAIFPEHGFDTKALMSHADAAMYEAKSRGGGFQIYRASGAGLDNIQHLKISADLRYALDRKQFLLRFQPKINIKNGNIHGAEALLRWRHPDYGLINPMEFIPLAERTGLITKISQWVVESVCAQQNKWLGSGINIPTTINVSSRSLHDSQMIDGLLEALYATSTPASMLRFDITENAFMSLTTRGDHTLEKLGEMGVHISVDDFGTGYSSLSSLKKMPIHSINIDKSLVIGMNENANNASIVRSSINLGHDLGLEVVAKGVENSEALDRLAQLNCDYAQGFYISHPLSVDELVNWVHSYERRRV